jgi:hypothetical protein
MYIKDDEWFGSDGHQIEFSVYPESEGMDEPFDITFDGNVSMSLADVNRLIKKLQWMKKAYKTVI